MSLGTKSDKSSNTPPTTNTTSAIQTAVASIYKVTKSTILQAAKSLSPTSMPTTSPTNTSIQVAIPLVDKDLKILPLPFATDPGPNWNWLENENSEHIIKEKSLTDEERMSQLKKYLDVVEIDINVQEVSGQNNVSNTSSGTGDNQTNTSNKTQDSQLNSLRKVPVAVLPCDNQPSFYKEVITGYLEKAKERFEFEKETKIAEPMKLTPSLKCANDNCDLYGTVTNNYLCTKCFQLQSKSIVKFQGPRPSYDPPSYSEAVGDDQVFDPPSFAGKSSNTEKTLQEMSVECRAPACSFYGTPGKNGFCSKCYHDENKK